MQHLLHQIKTQQFYINLGRYQKCLVLQKIVEFKDFSRLLSDFPVLFKADFIFKDFQGRSLNSSTFHACASPADPFFTDIHLLPSSLIFCKGA